MNQVVDAARSRGVTGWPLHNPLSLAGMTADDLREVLRDPNQAEAAEQEIANAAQAASTNLMSSLGANNPTKYLIEQAAREAGKLPIYLTREDIFAHHLPAWGTASAFQHSFSQLFVAYRDLALTNKLKRLANQNGDYAVTALSDDEFIARHQAPPWTFVNASLEAANLDFRIDSPDQFSMRSYRPTLTKISSGAEVRFADLSSGEKILMSFALCLYYANDRRQITAYPKLLLLDEIDAPLHPSMSRGLINTITGTLVANHGVNVIATTHSASTVALAPEDCIFLMSGASSGLHQVSKAEALNVLTEGVPTLAISVDGRRQIFVESQNDAELYDAVYQVLKPAITSERSLEFVPTGTKSQSGSDQHTGCDIVRHIVETLAKTGNKTVFGLLDWDGKNNPTDRIFVIAHGQRNGAESIFLDPLLLAAFIAGQVRTLAPVIGLNPTVDTYPQFLQFGPDKLQRIVDVVQQRVLGQPGTPVNSQYFGKFTLSVATEYLTIDDHKLEKRILEAFPQLRAHARKNGELMRKIVSTVVCDKPEFLPVCVIDTFTELLNLPTHQ